MLVDSRYGICGVMEHITARFLHCCIDGRTQEIAQSGQVDGPR